MWATCGQKEALLTGGSKTINRLTMLLKKSQCVSVSLPTNITHHILMGWKQCARKPVQIVQSELHAGVL